MNFNKTQFLFISIFLSFNLLLISANSYKSLITHLKKKVPCNNLSPGNYVWGCSKFYSTCTAEGEHSKSCVDNLVFNPDNNQCESPQNVYICQNFQPNALYRSKKKFNCEENYDGNFDVDFCSVNYYQCEKGNLFKRQCPTPLVFNPKTRKCDSLKNCQLNKKKHVVPIIISNKLIENSNMKNVNKKINITSAKKRYNLRRSNNNFFLNDSEIVDDFTKYSMCPTIDFSNCNPDCHKKFDQNTLFIIPIDAVKPSFCNEKIDGFYKLTPTSNIFFQCVSGHLSWRHCPTVGNVVDPIYVYCEKCHENNINFNTATTKSKTVSNLEYTITNNNINCSELLNGFYTNEFCTPNYYECKNSKIFKHVCQENKVFDSNIKNCVKYELCNLTKTTKVLTTTTTLSYATSKSIKTSMTFNCDNRSDGFYVKNNCDKLFYTCVNKIALKSYCSNGLSFDMSIGYCKNLTNCNNLEEKNYDIVGNSAIMNKRLFEYNCKQKSGFIAENNCQPSFVVCMYDKAFEYSCLENFLYDKQLQTCVEKNLCNNIEKVKVENNSFDEKTTPTEDLLNSETEICEDEDDSILPYGSCSPKYIICFQRTTLIETCEKDLIYNTENGFCDVKENVSGCTN